jgi:hypothetical protein
MSEEKPEISKRTVAYQMPGMDDVVIRQDLEYSAARPNKFTMDLYDPPIQPQGTRLPAVIIVAGYPDDVALFVARAGQDQLPHLNELLDRFVVEALACNLNITVVNHPEGPHAFDLLHDSEMSRGIIRQILAFFRFHLLP